MSGMWDTTTVASVAVAVALLSLVSYILSSRLGRFHPVSLYPLFWAVVLITPPAVGLEIYPPSMMALSIITVCAMALATGAYAGADAQPDQRQEGPQTYSSNLAIVLTIVTLMFFVGHGTFRAGIEVATGMSFDALDPRTIRYAQNYLEGGGGGVLSLFFSVGVVFVPLLLFAGQRYSRLFYLLIPVVFGLISQSPARTYSLTVAVVSVTFFFYQRAQGSSHQPHRVWRLLAVAVVALGLATGYFVTVGQSLGKAQNLKGIAESSWLPPGVDMTVLYFVGGVSALSVAIDAGFNPSLDAFGRSASVVFRVLSEIVPGVQVPDTIAPSSFIPVPFNVYTAPGDVWFDFGLAGVFVIFSGMGLVLRRAHDRALRGDPGEMFVAAYLVSTLLATPLNLNLLTIQSIFLLIVGWVAFRSLSWGPSRSSGSVRTDGRRVGADRPSRASTDGGARMVSGRAIQFRR